MQSITFHAEGGNSYNVTNVRIGRAVSNRPAFRSPAQPLCPGANARRGGVPRSPKLFVFDAAMAGEVARFVVEGG